MSQILKRIVVGVDGSPSAAEAIALAIRLARTHRSELYFSYAVDYALAASDAGAAVIDALTSEGMQILHKAQAIAANEGATASTKLLEGRPEYALVRHAQDVGADAIVVGTRGKSGVERFFLGSTAEGVLRLAEIPVFVAHGASLMAPRTFERIVVAIDNSDPSDAAIEFATTLACAEGSRLSFCHVIDEDTLYEEAANYEGATYPVLHQWLNEANILSSAAAQHAEGAGISGVESAVLTGNPVMEILGFTSAERADLIVIGAHGRRGVRHLVMGSVAQAVVRRSGIPVVVVRSFAGVSEKPVHVGVHPHVDWHGYVSLREEK
jgi:nucleotide-binding universal stress UspA family protein